MMRGVSTWAVAVRKPARQVASAATSSRGRPPRARSRSRLPARLGPAPAPAPAAAHRARRRRARRVPAHRLQRRSRSPRTPSSSEDEKEISGGAWWGTVALSLVVRDRPVLPHPGRRHEPVQATRCRTRSSSSSSRSSSGSRSSSATSGSSRGWRRCGASSSTTAPSTRRSPATRRGSSSRPRTRSASAAAPALRDELPAHRDDRGIVVFAPLGTPEWYWLFLSRIARDPARRRPRVRDHQVLRPQPQHRWAQVSCGRGCSSSASPRASPTPPSSRSRSPR